MIEGFNYSKSFMIISDHSKEITDKIMEELDRGATFLKGEGAYTGADKNVILVVVEKKEVVALKRLVREVDPKAFIIITDIHEACLKREWRIGLHIQHIICPIDVKPIYNIFLFSKDISR